MKDLKNTFVAESKRANAHAKWAAAVKDISPALAGLVKFLDAADQLLAEA